jgi:type II secretory pathway pseudopilin PulG
MMQAGKYVFIFVLSFLAAAALSGCTTRRQAAAQAHEAFLAGQNQALRQAQQQVAQTPGVTVVGPVQNPHVPWVAGLTLAQAIATANYLDSHAPGEIILTRQGESATLNPRVLLRGAQVPLEPGDVIELRPSD